MKSTMPLDNVSPELSPSPETSRVQKTASDFLSCLQVDMRIVPGSGVREYPNICRVEPMVEPVRVEDEALELIADVENCLDIVECWQQKLAGDCGDIALTSDAILGDLRVSVQRLSRWSDTGIVKNDARVREIIETVVPLAEQAVPADFRAGDIFKPRAGG